jgi:hypothetical protein
MENGESRRAVKGMVVRGMKPKMLFPMPLIAIPMTLGAMKGIEPRMSLISRIGVCCRLRGFYPCQPCHNSGESCNSNRIRTLRVV